MVPRPWATLFRPHVAAMTFFSSTDVGVNGSGASEHAFRNGQPIPMNSPAIQQFFNVNAFVNPLCSFKAQPFNAQVIEQENCTPEASPTPCWVRMGNRDATFSADHGLCHHPRREVH